MPNQRKKKSEQRWSMYPSLHHSVSRLLEEHNLHYMFHKSDDATTCIRDYDTNIMGRFVCHNNTCTNPGWASKVVPITIRAYKEQRYNARVYHQRCANCRHLSRPMLDESYAERVAYRIKKWAGISVEIPPYSDLNSKGPHQSNLCEGCKAGHCPQSKKQNR